MFALQSYSDMEVEVVIMNSREFKMNQMKYNVLKANWRKVVAGEKKKKSNSEVTAVSIYNDSSLQRPLPLDLHR